MASYPTLVDAILSYNGYDPKLYESLRSKHGILETAYAGGANAQIKQVGEKFVDIATGSWVSPGGTIIPANISSQVVQQDLFLMKYLQAIPADIAKSYLGGLAKLYDDKFPGVLQGISDTFANAAVYGNDPTFGNVAAPKGFHQYAKEAGNLIQATGTSGKRTSIFAVRWEPDVCGIAYNPVMAANGDFIESVPLFNGNTPQAIVKNTTTMAQRSEYQFEHSVYASLYCFDTKNIAAYTQIEDATGKYPTSDNLSYLLDMVKAEVGNTFLYVSRTGKRTMDKLKDGKLQMTPGDMEYNRQIGYFDSIPIILDEAILSNETTALD